MNAPFKAPQTPATPESYADYLALGMQKADKALPGGSAERKADYAQSYANSRAPVDVLPGRLERNAGMCVLANQIMERVGLGPVRQPVHGFYAPGGFVAACRKSAARNRIRKALIHQLCADADADPRVVLLGEQARQRHEKPVENGGFRLTAYGLEKISG